MTAFVNFYFTANLNVRTVEMVITPYPSGRRLVFSWFWARLLGMAVVYWLLLQQNWYFRHPSWLGSAVKFPKDEFFPAPKSFHLSYWIEFR
jgi:hypothetical protein